MKKCMILLAAVLVLLTGCAQQSAPTEAPTAFAAETAETVQSSLTNANEKITAAMAEISAVEKDQRYKTIQALEESFDEAKASYEAAAEACGDNEALSELKTSIEAALNEFPESMPLDVEFGINKFLKTMDKFIAAQTVCEQKAAGLFQQQ